jgi:hypothetical protein
MPLNRFDNDKLRPYEQPKDFETYIPDERAKQQKKLFISDRAGIRNRSLSNLSPSAKSMQRYEIQDSHSVDKIERQASKL